jgi:cytoskeletal protein CcmA (bactofilin family)
MEAEKPTVIDAEADLEGRLQGKDARILGRFRGEIELTGRLHVGAGANVDAKVHVDAAEIAGEYKGDLSARSLVLLESARVTGTLAAETLAVRDGATLNAAVSAGKPPKGKPAGLGAVSG